MKEIFSLTFSAQLQETTSQEIVEILQGMKQVAFLLRLESPGKSPHEYLFRFEEGIKLTLDIRIPKPQELYRDAAFHGIDRLLGWNITLPVKKWKFDGMRGVIRPYYRQVEKIAPYQIGKEPTLNDFLIKCAVMDYICGVVDRNYNDILKVNNTPFLIDSGLSFVAGTKFISQNSQIRDVFIGKELPEGLLSDLSTLNYTNILSGTSPHLTPDQIHQVLERKEILQDEQIIL